MALTSREIAQRIIPIVGNDDGDQGRRKHGHLYVADNGRTFNIWDMREDILNADKAFFMEEMRPNGRIVTQTEPYIECEDSEPIKCLLDSPNDFAAGFEKTGVSEDVLIRVGCGFGVYTRYFDSIEACAQAIEDSIDRNEWYDALDHELMADEGYKRKLQAQAKAGRREFRAMQQAQHEQAMATEHGLFKGLHSMIGPLCDETKQRILAFLNEPSKANWDAVAHTIVKGGTTMWGLWLSFDPEPPRSLPSTDDPQRWPCVPDPDQMREALVDLGHTSPVAA